MSELNKRRQVIELESDRVEAVLKHPVFIVGCPRSGTTWLHRLILSHPSVCGGPESGFFEQFWPVLANLNWTDASSPRDKWMLAYWDKLKLRNRIYALYLETFQDVVKNSPDAITFCEKTPNHAFRVYDIHQMLPKAKFIHIIRDSRSTVASLLAAHKGWGKHWAPGSAKDASLLWFRSVRQARKQSSMLDPSLYVEVHYEDLKNGTPEVLGKLYDFMGLEHDNQMLHEICQSQDFEKQKKIGGSRFDIGKQTVEPEGFFNKGKTDSWRKDLTIFQQLVVWRYTRKLMRQCGYGWQGRNQ